MRRLTILTLVALMLAISALPALAESENSASASTDIMSMYMWRGLRASEGLVIQPSVDFNRGAFNANIWVNYDADPDPLVYPDDDGVVNETDITLAYALPVEGLNISLGYIYYSMLGTDTQEAYIALSMEAGPIAPYLNVYYDYDLGTGAYAQLGADYSTEVGEGISLDLGGYISYLSDNSVVGTDAAGLEYSDLHNAELYASLGIQSGDISITPMVSYTFPLSDDAETAMTDAEGDDSHIYGGIS